MTGKYSYVTTVPYGDVDRRERMLLGRVFKLLQDAAIAHANQFGTGTQAVAERAETWMLSRIAAEIVRYPRADESLRVETWSTGIKSFKGFRDFRVYDAQGARVISASSLWLYVSLAAKAITRVPPDIVERFPVGTDAAWQPDLERTAPDLPAADATVVPVTLRYGDFDVNEHVNNAAYFDLLQTALARLGPAPHPRQVQLKYARAIPSTAERAEVRLSHAGAAVRFAIECEGVVCAQGAAEFAQTTVGKQS